MSTPYHTRILRLVLKLGLIASGLFSFYILFSLALIFVNPSNALASQHPRVQDLWRDASADGPDTIVVAWHARGTESSILHVNLTSGDSSGYTTWSMGPDLTSGVQSRGMVTNGNYHLTMDQCTAVRKWATALPPSDPINFPKSNRLMIIYNDKGLLRIQYYTFDHMGPPLRSLSQIMYKNSCLTDYVEP